MDRVGEHTKGTKQYEKLRQEDRDVCTNDKKRAEAVKTRRVSDSGTSQIVGVQIIDKWLVSLSKNVSSANLDCKHEVTHMK